MKSIYTFFNVRSRQTSTILSGKCKIDIWRFEMDKILKQLPEERQKWSSFFQNNV